MTSKEIKGLTGSKLSPAFDENIYQELKPSKNTNFALSVYLGHLHRANMKNAPCHWHAELEIIYVLSGNMKVYVEDTAVVLKKGDGIFINHVVPHSLRTINNRQATFFSLVFHPNEIFNYDSVPLGIKYLNPVLKNKALKYIKLDSTNIHSDSILNVSKKIYKFYQEMNYGYELICKAQLYLLWRELLFFLPPVSDDYEKDRQIANDEERINEAVAFIKDNYAESLTLEQIAESIHISKSECCRCFQRVLHLTPFEYLLHYRILMATKLLKNGASAQSSISDIAISVGFNNISYFNKTFKKIMNMTPTEYKKL